ncbi:MAG: PAS domain S-box protein, partial [Oceanospirillum sp.]|nr:PAS domain S-box protein [Oceanospirillum sp.]
MTSSTSVTHAQSSSDAERSAERELAMILDKSSDNIVVTDGDGAILKASSNFNRIYGLPISEAVGKTVQELQASGILTPSVTLEVLKRRRDVQLMQSTSQGFQVMALGFPIFDDAGEIERVISFSRDLTDLQMLQQEYEQLQQRLLQPLLDTRQSEELAGLAFKSRPVREIIQL